MDSIERNNREKYGLSDRGEKLFKRKPEDDHRKDKAKAADIRADNKEINEYDPSDKGRREKNPDNINDQVEDEKKKEEEDEKKKD